MRFLLSGILVVAAVALLLGCSGSSEKDKDGGVDQGIVVDSGLPDGYKLWPCNTPGQSCNAHDPCAIDPICGTDKLCRPTKLQRCDDGLDCTQDICKGMGLCENLPREGLCALPVKVGGSPDGGVGGTTEVQCFNKDQANPSDPCQLCDPDENKKQWTGANGGACNDGNDCTKDDYCQNGSCKGVYYGNQCADQYGCTDDICDGKGGCKGNELKSDWCLINGVCYKDGMNHPAGSCHTCDVSKTQSDWTPLSNTCMIDNKCYGQGDKHPTGTCAECNPSSSTDAWTVLGNTCLIEDVCKVPGDQDTTGCSECDPAKSKTDWTPLAGLCKIDGVCYKAGDLHKEGCAECDPVTDATVWTVKGNYCLIENVCKNPGDKDTTGCGQCDPPSSKIDWTPVQNQCLIGATCYQDQAKDTTGCLMCDVATNAKAWTPVAGAKTVTYDFESGNTTGWTLSPLNGKVGWQASNKRASGGSYALYYGDPVAGNYDTSGTANSGSATMPAFTPTAGKKAGISFMLYMDTENGTSYDMLQVFVGSTQVWEKTTTTVPAMKVWQEVTIDLSAYAGQSIVIKFEFDTSDSIANSSEGVYIDDITLYHNC